MLHNLIFGVCGYKRKGNIGFLVSVVSQKQLREASQYGARGLESREQVAGVDQKLGRNWSRGQGPRPYPARGGRVWAALCSSWLEDKPISHKSPPLTSTKPKTVQTYDTPPNLQSKQTQANNLHRSSSQTKNKHIRKQVITK